ncbi:hypothetical protein B9K06_12915 [Bacillus sp. OG2]|nr:hypothetical protein B9K06_12915 [Bacillus sp. OG2]
MDVMVGTDDAAPFIVNNTDILQEEAFSGGNLPDTFSVYNSNPAYQDMKVEGIIKGANIIEDPTEFRIGSYYDVGTSIGWTDTDQSVGDSGYGLLWSQRTVSGTGSFAVNTFYGLGVPPTIPDPTQTTLQHGLYDIELQVGANSGNKFKVQLSDVRTATLGIDDIGVEPYSRAMEALEKIDKSIKTVSSERSKYGAYQNGLEHVYNNVTNSSLNLTAAESRIRDVDIAKEMMEQTKNSILSQATQAILAQANQQPQGVLQLLR